MSEKVRNLKIRVMEKMARRFYCQWEGISANDLLVEYEGAVREDERSIIAREVASSDEQNCRTVKKMVYWQNRYELAVRGITDEVALRVLGREP